MLIRNHMLDLFLECIFCAEMGVYSCIISSTIRFLKNVNDKN